MQLDCSTGWPVRDWEGVQTIPREVRAAASCWSDPASDGCVLLVTPVPEIKQLRSWYQSAAIATDGGLPAAAAIAVAADQGADALSIEAWLGP